MLYFSANMQGTGCSGEMLSMSEYFSKLPDQKKEKRKPVVQFLNPWP